jgi:integrase
MGRKMSTTARVLGPYEEKTKDGKRFRVVQVTAEGKRSAFYASTLREAKMIVRACGKVLGLDAYKVVTLRAAVEEFIEHKTKTAAWSNATHERTGGDLRRFAKLAPDKPIGSVDVEFIRDYLTHVGKLALASQRSRYHAVREFIGWCTRKGHLKVDSCAAIDRSEKPWIGKRAKRLLGRGKPQLRNAAEVALYLQHARSLSGAAQRVAAMLPVLTGMRSGEVRHLRAGDADFEANRLWIRGADGDDEVGDAGWAVKTAASRRTVAMPADLRGDLDQLCRGKKPDALLFEVRPGRARERKWLLDLVRRVCREAGTRVVCPHGLRDTFTSLMAALAQASHAEIAHLIGHADQGQTARRHYIGVSAHQPALVMVQGALDGRPQSAPGGEV